MENSKNVENVENLEEVVTTENTVEVVEKEKFWKKPLFKKIGKGVAIGAGALTTFVLGVIVGKNSSKNDSIETEYEVVDETSNPEE